MTSEVFNEHLKYMTAVSVDTLKDKAKEYATNGDRLHNFKVASGIQGVTSQAALAGMMAKHTVSVYDMCESGERHPDWMWQEKITDSINYLLLLNAMVRETEP